MREALILCFYLKTIGFQTSLSACGGVCRRYFFGNNVQRAVSVKNFLVVQLARDLFAVGDCGSSASFVTRTLLATVNNR